MTDRFPDYDVLNKRNTLSWDARTRDVINARLDLPERSDVLTPAQIATLRALADRIVPQPQGRQAVNVVALILEKLAGETSADGYRHAGLPPARDAWKRGLDAIEAEAQERHRARFTDLPPADADALLRAVQSGDVRADWTSLPPRLFWQWRMLPDLVSAYYAHPSAWSAMGFGGPASPRGYVRLAPGRRDPWEPAEAGDQALLSASFRNRRVG
ncbi:gluconate 2-dehydrogenase subunit 3 family protein [Novosphingobium sp. M1R2S20]|uniref:Gluconate 2-dehydrogenase subunit 3 family protein n=1 Tax=Novosphingobium rhizovicinum TaxID=3228928 RepID=A0ABV3RG80_9SPHN